MSASLAIAWRVLRVLFEIAVMMCLPFGDTALRFESWMNRR